MIHKHKVSREEYMTARSALGVLASARAEVERSGLEALRAWLAAGAAEQWLAWEVVVQRARGEDLALAMWWDAEWRQADRRRRHQERRAAERREREAVAAARVVQAKPAAPAPSPREPVVSQARPPAPPPRRPPPPGRSFTPTGQVWRSP
jgi:hypothetical protein